MVCSSRLAAPMSVSRPTVLISGNFLAAGIILIFRACDKTSFKKVVSLDRKKENAILSPGQRETRALYRNLGSCICHLATTSALIQWFALTLMVFNLYQIYTQEDASFTLFSHPAQVDANGK